MINPFADHILVLKTVGISSDTTLYLVGESRMSYFTPSGKARLAANAKYHVYYIDDDTGETIDGRYHFTSKVKATKAFNEYKNQPANRGV